MGGFWRRLFGGGSSSEDEGSLREIYSGDIAIDSSEYTHWIERDDDDFEEAIPNLDTVVTKRERVTFTLDYPFEKPFEGAVEGPITLRAVIDAIRDGYRQMYADTTESEIPNLANRRVEGAYGTAFHVVGDLVIEQIELDEASGKLDICIGS